MEYKKEYFLAEKSRDRDGFIRSIFKDKTDTIVKENVLSLIRSKWDYISGNLALHSWPVKYAGARLTVRVEKSVYAQEMNMYVNWIMERIKELSINVESIKIETGPLNSNFSGFDNQKKNEEIKTSDNKRDLSKAQKEFLEGLKKSEN